MSRNYLHIKYLHKKMSKIRKTVFEFFLKNAFLEKNGIKFFNIVKKWNFSTEQYKHIFDKCCDKNSS